MPFPKTKTAKLSLTPLAAAVLVALSASAAAEDELSVQVVRNGAPVQSVSVVLDGNASRTVNRSGMAFHDLSAGQHSIQINESGQTVHRFRFA
jgi:hypothetical protein